MFDQAYIAFKQQILFYPALDLPAGIGRFFTELPTFGCKICLA